MKISTKPKLNNKHIKYYRWTFSASKYSIDFDREVSNDKNDWHYGAGYYSMCITKSFGVGYKTTYYDGNHNTISIGWLHFNWIT